MKEIDLYFCGYYEGLGRRENPNKRTRLLQNSKYHKNETARAEMVAEMLETILVERLRFDFITYAPKRDSDIDHARLLAVAIGKAVRCPVIGPSTLAKRKDLTLKRILLVDDVYTTGKTLTRLALQLLPHCPQKVIALVYLQSHQTAGKPISRPGS